MTGKCHDAEGVRPAPLGGGPPPFASEKEGERLSCAYQTRWSAPES